ncbi:MAG: mandelate racemase/muconate lactonizing enzyme family protein [Burkholderiaceae bacterium]
MTLAGLHVRLFDDPLDTAVHTSFGTMHSRAGLLVRLTDTDGVQGFGEVWCNFPEGGARYKATLLEKYVAPALHGMRVDRPEQVLARLRDLFAVLSLQCADHGAIAQLMAGVDQAAWDLFCKREGQAFWKLMGGRPEVPAYASGIGPLRIAETMRAQSTAGHRSFKIKLGFDEATDSQSLDTALAVLPKGADLMVDVNQGWTLEQTRAWLPLLAAAGVIWCEEPVRADTPWDAWRALAEVASSVRLALGENLLDMQRFIDAITLGGITVLQPDLGKWGGISDNLELAARVAQDQVHICPHWLAGGVGLMASFQFKAAIGGAGAVEMDVNPNRQRSDSFEQPWSVHDGIVVLPDTPGLIPPLAPWLLEAESWQAAELAL